MRIRTPVAFIVILMLVGWLFALPEESSSDSAASTESAPSVAPPKLQIKLEPRTSAPESPAPSSPSWSLEQDARRQSRWGPPAESERTSSWRNDVSWRDEARDGVSWRDELPWQGENAVPHNGELADDSSAPQQVSPSPLRPVEMTESLPRRTLKPVSISGIEFGAANDRGRDLAPAPQTLPRRQAAWEEPGRPFGEATAAARTTPPDPAAPRAPPFHPTATQTRHRIVNGDTLPALAGNYLGDERKSLLIYEANRDVLVSPEILPIGLELRIPAPPTSPAVTQTAPR